MAKKIKRGFQCKITKQTLAAADAQAKKRGIPELVRTFKDELTGLMMGEFKYSNGQTTVSIL